MKNFNSLKLIPYLTVKRYFDDSPLTSSIMLVWTRVELPLSHELEIRQSHFDSLMFQHKLKMFINPFHLLEIIVVLIWNEGAQGFMCFSLFTKYSFSIWRLFFLEIPKYQFTDGIKFIKMRPVPALLFVDSFWKDERINWAIAVFFTDYL